MNLKAEIEKLQRTHGHSIEPEDVEPCVDCAWNEALLEALALIDKAIAEIEKQFDFKECKTECDCDYCKQLRKTLKILRGDAE